MSSLQTNWCKAVSQKEHCNIDLPIKHFQSNYTQSLGKTIMILFPFVTEIRHQKLSICSICYYLYTIYKFKKKLKEMKENFSFTWDDGRKFFSALEYLFTWTVMMVQIRMCTHYREHAYALRILSAEHVEWHAYVRIDTVSSICSVRYPKYFTCFPEVLQSIITEIFFCNFFLLR